MTSSVEAVSGLLVLEPKPLRPFRSKDEYMYAMKEDLAEWFSNLYTGLVINAENFLSELETGVLLCKHANQLRQFVDEQKAGGFFETLNSNFVRDIRIPEYNVQYRTDIKPGTFLARDNVSNFITWTTRLGIPEVLRFETDDLVLCKNERSVVLCLLEVARIGAKFGMLAPTIVRMEEEIESEIETGKPPAQIITCDVKSLDEMVQELVGRCTCPRQFAIIKVGEGKYKIGDNQTLVFVRILRKHVMIRVGGGWDTLEHYLDRHDPCRCGFQGGRPAVKNVVQPRRSSTPSLSQSNTPQPTRKSSVTSTLAASRTAGSDGKGVRLPSPRLRSSSPTHRNAAHISETDKYAHKPVCYQSDIPTTGTAKQPSNESMVTTACVSKEATKDMNVCARVTGSLRQITLSDLRYSRDGYDLKEPSSSSSATQKLSSEDKSDVDMATGNFAIDKISTMSLGEFKNLLNSTLTVPSSGGQRSDSPQSHSSGDSYKAITDRKAECRISNTETNYSRVSSKLSSKQSLDYSSGYSTSSPSSDKTTKSTSCSLSAKRTSAIPDSFHKSERIYSRSKHADMPFNNNCTTQQKTKPITAEKKRLDQNAEDMIRKDKLGTFTQTNASKLTTRTQNASENIKAKHRDLYSVNTVSMEPIINETPQNVGYVSVSFEAVTNDSVDNKINDLHVNKHIQEKSETGSPHDVSIRPNTPSGRTTPSLIPRPLTPKLPKKLSQTAPVEIHNRSGRPPTPRKPNVVVRANDILRSTDKTKEQTYRDIFRKRSTTPSSECLTNSVASFRRAVTPGPYLSSTLTLEQNEVDSSSRETQVLPQTNSLKEKIEANVEPVIVVSVDRSANKHTLSLTNQRVESKSDKPSAKSKVLARARAQEHNRGQKKTLESNRGKRPQSVEPRQLFPQTNKPEEMSYDRTQEWVQTTARQTKVKQPKSLNMRRAMTPNSMLNDSENTEPRSLEDIKAALTLPIHGLKEINTEQLEAPPEDPEMYATMEKLFHELRKHELKSSVNETPGDIVQANSSYPRSQSSTSESNNIRSNKPAEMEPISSSRRNSQSNTSSQTKHISMKMSNSISDSAHFIRKTSIGSSVSAKINTRSPSLSPNTHSSKRPPSPLHTASMNSQPCSEKITLKQQQSLSNSSVRILSSLKHIASRPVLPCSHPLSSSASSPSGVGSVRSSSTPPYDSNPDSPASCSDVHDSNTLVNKIKEIIKVQPRKDKMDGLKKTKIPAPRSLSHLGKSRSVCNLLDLDTESNVMENSLCSGTALEDKCKTVNGSANDTLSPKWATPLTTGRSSLIRKESMEKNRNTTGRFVRTLSIDRKGSTSNLSQEGEYV